MKNLLRFAEFLNESVNVDISGLEDDVTFLLDEAGIQHDVNPIDESKFEITVSSGGTIKYIVSLFDGEYTVAMLGSGMHDIKLLPEPKVELVTRERDEVIAWWEEFTVNHAAGEAEYKRDMAQDR